MAEDAVSNQANAEAESCSEHDSGAGTANIPMPADSNKAGPATVAGGVTFQSDAWERAQAALKKIAPSAPSVNQNTSISYYGCDFQPYQDMQTYMMQYYPWMARSAYTMPFVSPQQFQPPIEPPNSYMNPYSFYGRPLRPPRPPPPPGSFRPSGLSSQLSHPPNASPVRPAAHIPSSSSFDQPSRPPGIMLQYGSISAVHVLFHLQLL